MPSYPIASIVMQPVHYHLFVMTFATVTFQMIYLCAPNDANGNPRRAWFLLNDFGSCTEIFEEGYSGTKAVPAKYRDAQLAAPRINVTVSEFNSWIKSVI